MRVLAQAVLLVPLTVTVASLVMVVLAPAVTFALKPKVALVASKPTRTSTLPSGTLPVGEPLPLW